MDSKERDDQRGRALSTVMISLIVIKKGDLFIATNETRGWYLPAGRVDFGETFDTGARRECLEEAGLEVKLTGIYRIEQNPDPRSTRFRCVYAADLVDESAKPRGKDTADDEIIEAVWITPDELKTKNVRSQEVVKLFNWVKAKNPSLAPCSIFSGTDGPVINDKVVVSKLHYRLVVIIFHKNKPNQLFCINDSHLGLVPASFYLTKSGSFEKLASKLFCQQNVELNISGLLHVHHVPPVNLESTGEMTWYFKGDFKSRNDYKKLISNKVGSWENAESIKMLVDTDALIVKEVLANTITPLGDDRFVLEGTPFQ